ncbi:carbohydrate ABC transporter permease [Paenibacillus sp. R14(2021)]|uniref:carbohydrate ABC transporter permease n=1 Tax=Paenibacillus sp. R14(2021) TaxID=2859228 RepID=UPI001C6120CB|nr:sugar ABC transporter permease [Paenibacillus sp. R14(2021)]
MKKSFWQKDGVIGYMFILPGVIGFLFFVAYPLLSSIYFSMTKWSGFDTPKFIGLKNFKYMFTMDPTFWPGLRATILYAVISVPLGLVLGLALAMLLNRSLPGIKIFRTLFYLPVVLPIVATSTLWLFVYEPQFGLANNVLKAIGLHPVEWLTDSRTALMSLMVIALWGVGSNMIIFLGGLQSVPSDVYEAAEIDGASKFRAFFSVTIPLITPTLFLQLITGMIGAFQTFVQPSILTKDGGPDFSTMLLNFSIYKNAFQGQDFGYAIAQVWVLFVLIILFTIIAFKSSSSFVYYENDSR